MKRVLTIYLVLISSLVFSQGLKLGATYSTMTDQYLDLRESKFFLGYQFGFTTLLETEEPGFYMEFNYEQKGRRITGSEDHSWLSLTQDYNDRIPYLNLPVLFTYPFSDKLVLEMGPNLGVRLWGRRKGEYTVDASFYDLPITVETNTKYSDTLQYQNLRRKRSELPEDFEGDREHSRPLKIFDVGLNVGVHYFLSDDIRLNVRYNYGLLDVFNNNYPGVAYSDLYESNRSLQISLIINLE